MFSQSMILHLLLMVMTLTISTSSSSPPNNGMILRIRQNDGSIQKVLIPPHHETNTTLAQILQATSLDIDDDDEKSLPTITKNNQKLDITKTISELNLQHGTLLSTITPTSNKLQKATPPSTTTTTSTTERFDPFPTLSKPQSYSQSSRRLTALSSQKRGMTFSHIDKMTSYMHKIESQPQGPVKRIYMCQTSATRFQSNLIHHKKQQIKQRVGILFGVTSKERVDPSAIKVRTSLSTPLADREMCEVVKVHAIWEPNRQKEDTEVYDDRFWDDCSKKEREKVLQLGRWLGLQPVGWIFSFREQNRTDKSEVPMLGNDVIVASELQIENMKTLGREKGSRFVTLCLDSQTGATEAFQVSDVAVQMVAEGVLMMPTGDEREVRYIPTSDPVLVDGKEVRQVDSVLCLVNTAMLSHEGIFAGNDGSVGKKGGLTSKAKKRILTALKRNGGEGEEEDDDDVLKVLCDFNLLCGLDKILGEKEMEEICRLVVKWSRGQKKGTRLRTDLRLLLQSVLGG